LVNTACGECLATRDNRWPTELVERLKKASETELDRTENLVVIEPIKVAPTPIPNRSYMQEGRMTFEAQNALEQSLVKAASDPAYRPQLYKDFVQSDIFILQHGRRPPEKAGQVTLAEAATIQISNIEFNGKQYIPIFSSIPRMQAALTGEASYLGMNALEFLRITKGSALLLNPGSDYGKEISAEEAASIVDGSFWQAAKAHVVPEATQIMLGQPANYPTELVAALTGLFKKKRQVKRAWLAHAFIPGQDQKPHTLIAIDASDGFDEVLAEAGIVMAQDVNIPDPPVDFLPITGGRGIEEYFTKDTKPFYERRFLGLF